MPLPTVSQLLDDALIFGSVGVTGISRVRALNRLSAVKVAKLKQPGLYEDGDGSRLVVTGSTRSTLRVTINGRRVELGLGVWPTVSLEDARRKEG